MKKNSKQNADGTNSTKHAADVEWEHKDSGDTNEKVEKADKDTLTKKPSVVTDNQKDDGHSVSESEKEKEDADEKPAEDKKGKKPPFGKKDDDSSDDDKDVKEESEEAAAEETIEESDALAAGIVADGSERLAKYAITNGVVTSEQIAQAKKLKSDNPNLFSKHTAEDHGHGHSSKVKGDMLKKESEDFDKSIGELMEMANLDSNFKTKVKAIFEAAIEKRVYELEQDINSKFELQIEAAKEELNETYADRIDDYLTTAANTWLNENEVAIESSIKTSILENFMEGVKNVFSESYIEVDEDKVDYTERLSVKYAELDESNTELEELVESITKENEALVRTNTFLNLREGLSENQADKFRVMLEKVSFENDEIFEENASMLKETYFPESVENKLDEVTVEHSNDENQESEEIVSENDNQENDESEEGSEEIINENGNPYVKAYKEYNRNT